MSVGEIIKCSSKSLCRQRIVKTRLSSREISTKTKIYAPSEVSFALLKSGIFNKFIICNFVLILKRIFKSSHISLRPAGLFRIKAVSLIHKLFNPYLKTFLFNFVHGLGVFAIAIIFLLVKISKAIVIYFARSFKFSCYAPLNDVNRPARISLVAAGLALFIGVICFRLYTIQDTEYEKWVLLAGKQHNTSIEIQGVRGTLRDAAGRILAVSVQAASFGAHPRQVKSIEKTASLLAGTLEMDETELVRALSQNKSFVWLSRGLPAGVAEKVERLGLKGVVTIPEFRRYYPHQELAAPLLGRVNRDGAGQSGVEAAYEQMLKAGATKVEVRRDAKGRLVAATTDQSLPWGTFRERGRHVFDQDPKFLPVSLSGVTEGSNSMRQQGTDIDLSIDAYLQNILEEELKRGKEEAQAKHIIGLLMDAQTGEILALGQAPTFNPNQYKDISPENLKNYVLQDNFEPGSTFKPLVAAVALDQGYTRMEEEIDCEMGKYQVGKYLVRDVHPAGVLTVKDVLIRSSNICMAKLGQRLGKEKLGSALREYGFGKATGINLEGEGEGIMRDPSKWANIDIATHSFGQGISVTALQLVQAYSAIANEGQMVKPSIVKRNLNQVESKRVLKPETAQILFDTLTGVTEDEHGTGKNAKILGVRVAGKTGTAQKPRVGARGYNPEAVLASFVGIVDASQIGINHRLIMLVAVDEPEVKPRWGGVVAAPVFKRAMERILSHLLTVNKNIGIQTAGTSSRANQNL